MCEARRWGPPVPPLLRLPPPLISSILDHLLTSDVIHVGSSCRALRRCVRPRLTADVAALWGGRRERRRPSAGDSPTDRIVESDVEYDADDIDHEAVVESWAIVPPSVMLAPPSVVLGLSFDAKRGKLYVVTRDAMSVEWSSGEDGSGAVLAVPWPPLEAVDLEPFEEVVSVKERISRCEFSGPHIARLYRESHEGLDPIVVDCRARTLRAEGALRSIVSASGDTEAVVDIDTENHTLLANIVAPCGTFSMCCGVTDINGTSVVSDDVIVWCGSRGTTEVYSLRPSGTPPAPTLRFQLPEGSEALTVLNSTLVCWTRRAGHAPAVTFAPTSTRGRPVTRPLPRGCPAAAAASVEVWMNGASDVFYIAHPTPTGTAVVGVTRDASLARVLHDGHPAWVASAGIGAVVVVAMESVHLEHPLALALHGGVGTVIAAGRPPPPPLSSVIARALGRKRRKEPWPRYEKWNPCKGLMSTAITLWILGMTMSYVAHEGT